MSSRFPEITTFGSLFTFAMMLEELALKYCAALDGDGVAAVQKRHDKRLKRLEQARRELLNEVTLEPLHDIGAEKYLKGLLSDEPITIERMVALQRQSKAFYADSAETARNMLTEISRIFVRMAKENDKNLKSLAN